MCALCNQLSHWVTQGVTGGKPVHSQQDAVSLHPGHLRLVESTDLELSGAESQPGPVSDLFLKTAGCEAASANGVTQASANTAPTQTS